MSTTEIGDVVWCVGGGQIWESASGGSFAGAEVLAVGVGETQEGDEMAGFFMGFITRVALVVNEVSSVGMVKPA